MQGEAIMANRNLVPRPTACAGEEKRMNFKYPLRLSRRSYGATLIIEDADKKMVCAPRTDTIAIELFGRLCPGESQEVRMEPWVAQWYPMTDPSILKVLKPCEALLGPNNIPCGRKSTRRMNKKATCELHKHFFSDPHKARMYA